MKKPTRDENETDPDERKSVTMPRSMWSDIDSYGAQERIKTQSEALRRIVQAGLRALMSARHK